MRAASAIVTHVDLRLDVRAVDLAADERETLTRAATILRARVERLDAASEAAEAKAHEADAMFFESRSRECERSAKTIERELAALPLKGGR